MKSKALGGMAAIVVLLLVASMGAVAQNGVRFSGLINDYTPSIDNNQTPAVNLGGPWEIRGEWTLTVDKDGKADFSAALTMERSDEGALLQPGGLDSTSARKAHTHHLRLVDGTLTVINHGFEVSGTATLTGNGTAPPNPPFSSPSIPLRIDITGSDLVKFSNIQLFLEGDAMKHFGSQAVNGVVKNFH